MKEMEAKDPLVPTWRGKVWLNRRILISLIVLTIAMISLGGLTRLTGSGLSMVDWNLIMGIVPPINEGDWQDRFKEYQKFPEYQVLNFNMTLSEFKRIFYYEYSHRILGRIIGGMTFLLLLISFLTGQSSKVKVQFFFLFVLVSLQGLMGWYMVKSGLVDVPQVSHYRLLAHFLLAMLFLAWLLHLLFQTFPDCKVEITPFPLLIINLTSIVFVIQIAFGALLAGLDAGLVSFSYPQMFGEWIPQNLMAFPGSMISKLFDNPVFINFFHRHWGILTAGLLILSGIIALVVARGHKPVKYFSITLIALATLQPLVGIVTLIMQVPVSWAAIHQLLAVLIWSALLSLRLLMVKKSLPKSAPNQY